jgi:hypothetical protein
MTRLEYILERLHDAQLRNDMAKVVADVDALIPHSEDEFSEILKFGLYPAGQCVPFVTKQGTPFYQLDNMAMVPKGDTANYLRYGDFEFRQLEVLYNMARMDSAEAHHWLKDNLFQGCRVDARKKTEYKSKFKGCERADWKTLQVEWMKYCLNLKYRCNALFRKDLANCMGKLPVEDATHTKYASNLFWGASLVEVDGKKYYFGCNVLGKLLAEIRKQNGKLAYKLPEDLHLFGEPVI